jgi:hypothetical protein
LVPDCNLSKNYRPCAYINALTKNWCFGGLVDASDSQRAVLADNAVVSDDGSSMDHNPGLMLDDDTATYCRGIRKLYAILIPDTPVEVPIK